MPKRPVIEQDFFGDEETLTRLTGGREGVTEVDARVEDIDPNPFNPRKTFNNLEELAQSMREHGFMGALDGRIGPSRRIQIGYGARRLAAAKLANIPRIHVYLHNDWDDQRMLTIALVENIQREDLEPLEAAQGLWQMSSQLHWSQEQIAQRLGKSRNWVRDMLALAQADPALQELAQEDSRRIRHIHYLTRVEDPGVQRQLVEAIRLYHFDQNQVKQAVDAVLRGVQAHEAVDLARGLLDSRAKVQRGAVSPTAQPVAEPAYRTQENPADDSDSSADLARLNPRLPQINLAPGPNSPQVQSLDDQLFRVQLALGEAVKKAHDLKARGWQPDEAARRGLAEISARYQALKAVIDLDESLRK